MKTDTAPVAGKNDELTELEKRAIEHIAGKGRNEVIKVIRHHLKKRTGKAWSVTGGRGTAWGWITITSPPARQVNHRITDEDGKELGEVLGLGPSHHQGINIPSQTDYYREFLFRAIHGHAGPFIATAQWD